MGRPFAASGACADRTWRAIRAIYICGCVRRAAASRREATARSGIIGWTIRDPSCLPLDGRRNPAAARPTLRDEAMRMHRCGMRAAATPWLRRVRAFRAPGMGVARLAGCDPLARKRPAQRTRRADTDGGASAATRRSERRAAAGSCVPWVNALRLKSFRCVCCESPAHVICFQVCAVRVLPTLFVFRCVV